MQPSAMANGCDIPTHLRKGAITPTGQRGTNYIGVASYVILVYEPLTDYPPHYKLWVFNSTNGTYPPIPPHRQDFSF